ncbi:uncharacterized protein LOC129611195 [Condylostylus longicornis]|uniref:uncharacterized protein LOC129611195 n=1 Tax=Condylostylus longicornis TaxID=2530218 RepID=UPI00244DFEF4|nr:uncharacterized protein LOC129611195 [Condylostylus longicornis]
MEKLIKISTLLATFLFTILLDNITSAQQFQRSINPASSNILDIEIPQNFYVFKPSPLRNAQQFLQEPSYYSFLNTLYRHDKSKANLFTNPPPVQIPSQNLNRRKRAVVFRPLFVYRQQEIKKQKYRSTRRRKVKVH